MIISHMIPMGRTLYLPIPLLNEKMQPDAGKYTSAMDPRGLGVFIY